MPGPRVVGQSFINLMQRKPVFNRQRFHLTNERLRISDSERTYLGVDGFLFIQIQRMQDAVAGK